VFFEEAQDRESFRNLRKSCSDSHPSRAWTGHPRSMAGL